jgi:hypothetical protein
MALIQRAHHEFKLDCQAIDSNVNLDLPKAHIDDLLYRGLLEYINVFYTGRNEQGYPLGFEVTQRRIDLLSHLVIPSDLGAGTLIGTEDGFDILEYELPEDYLHFVRGYSIGACGKLSIDIVTHDDLSGALSTSSKAPSTKWGRALGVFRQGKFYLYLESADVTNTRIEYVKKPLRPFFGGYDSLEFIAGDNTAPNSGSNSVDLDIPEQWTHLVTRIAAAIYFSRISGFNKAQYLNSETLRG